MFLAGEVRGVSERQGTTDSGSYTFVELHVLDGLNMHRVSLGRDFGAMVPRVGEQLVAEVSVRAFKRRDGGAGFGLTALRRVDDSELMGLLEAVQGADAKSA